MPPPAASGRLFRLPHRSGGGSRANRKHPPVPRAVRATGSVLDGRFFRPPGIEPAMDDSSEARSSRNRRSFGRRALGLGWRGRPFAGAWIETRSPRTSGGRSSVALRGGVDWNLPGLECPDPCAASPRPPPFARAGSIVDRSGPVIRSGSPPSPAVPRNPRDRPELSRARMPRPPLHGAEGLARVRILLKPGLRHLPAIAGRCPVFARHLRPVRTGFALMIRR